MIGRSKVQLLTDGSPRAIKAVFVRREKGECLLIEIDTSDSPSLLSTKLIYSPNRNKWNGQFLDIRLGVVRNSLAWPKELLDNFYGEKGHLSIPHPKHDGSDTGNIPLHSVEGWARRVFKYLT